MLAGDSLSNIELPGVFLVKEGVPTEVNEGAPKTLKYLRRPWLFLKCDNEKAFEL